MRSITPKMIVKSTIIWAPKNIAPDNCPKTSASIGTSKIALILCYCIIID
ncbi:MAG: hypothetical protein QXE78_02635 [Nitrososphaeria archaeon]